VVAAVVDALHLRCLAPARRELHPFPTRLLPPLASCVVFFQTSNGQIPALAMSTTIVLDELTYLSSMPFRNWYVSFLSLAHFAIAAYIFWSTVHLSHSNDGVI
jgi:hypothetical protein